MLYFKASNVNGAELWKSDGTAEGTLLVKDFIQGLASGSPSAVIEAGGKLYVAATTVELGRELYVADPVRVSGDYNRDTLITPADHTFWAANFGATSGVGLQADGNNNGVVDAADYNIWRDNYTPPAPVASATAAVSAPELWPAPTSSVAKPTRGNVRGPIAASPQRREALLIAARETALVEFNSSDTAPCGPLAHGSESEESTESAARDGVFALLGSAGL